MRAGRALRDKWQDEANAKRPCPKGCPHLNTQHHELPRHTYALSADGTGITEVSNPDYRPLHFHCDVADCDCVFTVD